MDTVRKAKFLRANVGEEAICKNCYIMFEPAAEVERLWSIVKYILTDKYSYV